MLADVEGILPRVEEALRALQAQGRAGKTLANYAEALTAFCDWCVQRGYLAFDPLRSLKTFDTTPRTQRRAMTAEEITSLLRTCAAHRRLLLETAFLSGLRANELRNLTTDHLDRDQFGLRLDAAWTKNRKPGFQPLSASLVERLAAFAHSGEPCRLYERFYGRKTVKELPPAQPLLYVPSHPARELDKDLLAAGIPKSTPAGKLDFHACRVAYINLVIESGVNIKEAQTLARHATPQLTMNVYGRVREERLAQAVEKMAQTRL
jgi:integrase/recombinase XerD